MPPPADFPNIQALEPITQDMVLVRMSPKLLIQMALESEHWAQRIAALNIKPSKIEVRFRREKEKEQAPDYSRCTILVQLPRIEEPNVEPGAPRYVQYNRLFKWRIEKEQGRCYEGTEVKPKGALLARLERHREWADKGESGKFQMQQIVLENLSMGHTWISGNLFNTIVNETSCTLLIYRFLRKLFPNPYFTILRTDLGIFEFLSFLEYEQLFDRAFFKGKWRHEKTTKFFKNISIDQMEFEGLTVPEIPEGLYLEETPDTKVYSKIIFFDFFRLTPLSNGITRRMKDVVKLNAREILIERKEYEIFIEDYISKWLLVPDNMHGLEKLKVIMRDEPDMESILKYVYAEPWHPGKNSGFRWEKFGYKEKYIRDYRNSWFIKRRTDGRLASFSSVKEGNDIFFEFSVWKEDEKSPADLTVPQLKKALEDTEARKVALIEEIDSFEAHGRQCAKKKIQLEYWIQSVLTIWGIIRDKS